ncbi:glycosyltransferase [Vibrio breoganii]|uniref:glycosyltransferase n=1 Tax=Vibrio breoganii TaxID=553239 RepID=UPI000C863781|nr:glycosyltransferase [Vibrio breoganii]PMM49034.1 hypothetical protein BCT52_03780 [Vibrio breoganii]
MNTLLLVNETISPNQGVSKKILSQFDALKKISGESHICYIKKLNDSYVRVIDDDKVISKNYSSKYMHLFIYKSMFDFIDINNIDLVYIRYSHFANPFFLRFLKKLKAKGIITLIEIPTFPYDVEYRDRGFLPKIKLTMDKIFRRDLRRYVSNVVTFTNEDAIFGIDTIRISNAISICKFDNSKKQQRNKNELKLLAVANLGKWHGYDRLIKTLGSFYAKNSNEIKVYFHLVGDGPELSYYKTLVSEFNIEEYVIFYGELDGDELVSLYHYCDIGVDSLGRHRTGNIDNNSLKSKEYFSYGLPIIKSHKDSFIDGTKFDDVCLNIQSDESLFDIDEVIKWYDQLTVTTEEISIRANKEFSWEKQLSKCMWNK